jgi:hypothetical protein
MQGSLCPQGLKALYPPDGGVGAVELLPGDLAHLDDQEFLNDTVIDFYMKRAPTLNPPRVPLAPPAAGAHAGVAVCAGAWRGALRIHLRLRGSPAPASKFHAARRTCCWAGRLERRQYT